VLAASSFLPQAAKATAAAMTANLMFRFIKILRWKGELIRGVVSVFLHNPKDNRNPEHFQGVPPQRPPFFPKGQLGMGL